MNQLAKLALILYANRYAAAAGPVTWFMLVHLCE